MKKASALLDWIRYAAAGGIVASAVANIAFSPSNLGNWGAAAIGGLLTIILVKRLHLVQ